MKYPNESFKAPDISGVWKVYAEYIYLDANDPIPRQPKPSLNNPGKLEGEIKIVQNNLFVTYTEESGKTRIGSLQPQKIYKNGKSICSWWVRFVEDGDNGVLTWNILCDKNNRAYKIFGSEAEGGFLIENPSQGPITSVFTLTRKCKK